MQIHRSQHMCGMETGYHFLGYGFYIFPCVCVCACTRVCVLSKTLWIRRNNRPNQQPPLIWFIYLSLCVCTLIGCICRANWSTVLSIMLNRLLNILNRVNSNSDKPKCINQKPERYKSICQNCCTIIRSISLFIYLSIRLSFCLFIYLSLFSKSNRSANFQNFSFE